MRLLAISDIHGNISAVRQLRSQESNSFDAIVVAGDIGRDNAPEIFDSLMSFGCPVLYVYGNWDHELEYDHSFGPACEHLHLRHVECGPYSFVGFSGLPTHWGRNPIAEIVRHEISAKNKAVLNRRAECEAAVEAATLEIESAHQARVVELASQTRDRRTSQYQAKLKKIENQRDRLIAKAWLPLEQLEESLEYTNYVEEGRSGEAEIAKLNRRALVEAIKASKAGHRRTIVVTHERLYRTSDDLAEVPLFLFGHRHGFRETIFEGSRFVNVSVLDRAITVRPAGKRQCREIDYRSMNTGNYVIIETKSLRDFDVKCVSFEPKFDCWKLVGNFRIHGAPWIE